MRYTGLWIWHGEVISSGPGMQLCTVMYQLLEHPEGQAWFCLGASSVQNVVVPSCELGLQLLVTHCGSGDAPAADQDSDGGFIIQYCWIPLSAVLW